MLSRRALLATLILASGLACGGSARAAIGALQIQFLNQSEASALMAGPSAKPYFDAMYGPELIAKTGLDIQNLPLNIARDNARAIYASEALEFSQAEQDVLRWGVSVLWPTLIDKAPLFARTPWKFAKVSDRIEGGQPHTRDDTIVFSARVAADLASAYRDQDLSKLYEFLGYLLAHEQTHVLQRSQPAVFADLINSVLGFERVPALQSSWLSERGAVNPDGPVNEWVFPLPGGKQAVLPYLVLDNLTHPRMPDDFRTVAVMAEKAQGRWAWVMQDGVPVTQPLSDLKAYASAFPNPDENYHPNEIAADMLGYWLAGRTDGDTEHPLRAKLVKWAKKNLD
jgi:hypothetical protein